MNIILILIAAILLALLVRMTHKKISAGASCCGEHEAGPDRIKPEDQDPRHYPFHYRLKVEGMVCGNCTRRVENAFHEKKEYLAFADLGKREVALSAKRALTRQETAKILDEEGYTLMDFEEVKL